MAKIYLATIFFTLKMFFKDNFVILQDYIFLIILKMG